MSENKYVTVPKVLKIRKEVNSLTASDSGCTSPKPTVVMVITIIKKASKKDHFSISIKPLIPKIKIKVSANATK
jgi:hypothetical protein